MLFFDKVDVFNALNGSIRAMNPFNSPMNTKLIIKLHKKGFTMKEIQSQTGLTYKSIKRTVNSYNRVKSLEKHS